MRKNPLIVASIGLVCVIVLASLNNVVGYQSVQSSNQIIMHNDADQKEFLFQTLVDMANNKVIKRVILGSELIGKRFNDPSMRFSAFTFPVITEKFLKRAYTIGVILSKTFSKAKMHSILQQFQVRNQEVQKEITAVIEKDAKLNREIMQLSNSKCDCENENITNWNFPILCLLLIPFLIVALWLAFHTGSTLLGDIIVAIASILHCSWLH